MDNNFSLCQWQHSLSQYIPWKQSLHFTLRWFKCHASKGWLSNWKGMVKFECPEWANRLCTSQENISCIHKIKSLPCSVCIPAPAAHPGKQHPIQKQASNANWEEMYSSSYDICFYTHIARPNCFSFFYRTLHLLCACAQTTFMSITILLS